MIGRGALATGGAAVAIAAGLQNAMATRLSAAVVRTTHMTGVLTDLGIALGKALAGRGVTGWRVVIYLSLLGGFAGGSFAGVALHLWLADAGLYVAAALLASLGALYWIWRAGRREP